MRKTLETGMAVENGYIKFQIENNDQKSIQNAYSINQSDSFMNKPLINNLSGQSTERPARIWYNYIIYCIIYNMERLKATLIMYLLFDC